MKLTGVFPSKNLSFSKNIEVREDCRIIKVQSSVRLKKKGNIITIGTEEVSIRGLTIQEVVKILLAYGVDVVLVDSGSRFLPASLINDFESVRVKQIEPNTNPYNINKLLYEPYYKLQKLQLPNIKNIAVFNKGIRVSSKVIDSNIYYSNGSNTTLFYTLEYTKYYITISSNTLNPASSSELYRLAHLGIEK